MTARPWPVYMNISQLSLVRIILFTISRILKSAICSALFRLAFSLNYLSSMLNEKLFVGRKIFLIAKFDETFNKSITAKTKGKKAEMHASPVTCRVEHDELHVTLSEGLKIPLL